LLLHPRLLLGPGATSASVLLCCCCRAGKACVACSSLGKQEADGLGVCGEGSTDEGPYRQKAQQPAAGTRRRQNEGEWSWAGSASRRAARRPPTPRPRWDPGSFSCRGSCTPTRQTPIQQASPCGLWVPDRPGIPRAVQAPITTQQVRQRPAQPHQEVSAERGVDRCVLARSAVGEPDTKDLPFSASRESPAALRPMPLGRGCGLGAGVEAQRGLPSRPSWA